MAVWVVTGKLGSGKSMVAVGRMLEYMRRGCHVATNLDLYLDQAFRPRKRLSGLVYRVPDKPTVADLQALGNGNPTYDESKNGLLVLDECGTWFNSRTWNDKGRKALIDWFLHARKKGWDIIFIVQDISIMDKQARETLAEHTVFCRRLDRLSIPIITPLLKLFTGIQVRLPRIHVATVRYGDNEQAIKVDRWIYRGADVYKVYDTKQVFVESDNGTSCFLDPWLLRGRYMTAVRWGAWAFRVVVVLPTVLCLLPWVLLNEGRRLRRGRRPSPVGARGDGPALSVADIVAGYLRPPRATAGAATQ